MDTTPRRTALLLAALVTALAVTGCSGSGDSGRSDSGGESEARAGLADAASEPADGLAAPVADDAAGDAGKVATAQQPAVIATGTVSLEAKDVARARLAVRKVVDAHQGRLGEQETTTGDEGELSTVRMVLRVPSDHFDAVVAEVERVATPTGTTTSSEDVSAEVVDVAARIRAQRKSVSRIETLLARAETIEQIVAIESQLASRQADLDALESRQQWLADQTGMSTLSVYIEQPSGRDDHQDDEADDFLSGLANGWDAFVDGARAVLVVVGFLVPWLVLLALLAVPLRLVLRRRTRGPAPTA